MQIAQEPAGIRRRLGGQDEHEDPPCCPIDGHEQIVPRGLIRRLGQVFQVDVPPLGDRKRSPAGQREAGLVGLECLARLGGGLGKQRLEIAHTVPPQAPIQA